MHIIRLRNSILIVLNNGFYYNPNFVQQRVYISSILRNNNFKTIHIVIEKYDFLDDGIRAFICNSILIFNPKVKVILHVSCKYGFDVYVKEKYKKYDNVVICNDCRNPIYFRKNDRKLYKIIVGDVTGIVVSDVKRINN